MLDIIYKSLDVLIVVLAASTVVLGSLNLIANVKGKSISTKYNKRMKAIWGVLAILYVVQMFLSAVVGMAKFVTSIYHTGSLLCLIMIMSFYYYDIFKTNNKTEEKDDSEETENN